MGARLWLGVVLAVVGCEGLAVRPSDGGSPLPVVVDGGDAGSVDAGSNPCLRDNGGCDQLTTCVPSAAGRACGACPAGYTGTGETGCLAQPVDAGLGRGTYGREGVAAFDALSAQDRASLANLKVLLHHHSVGENLMGWWTDDTAAGGPTQPGGAAKLGFPFAHAASPSAYAGALRLGETSGGVNGDPAGKLASFADVISTQGYGGVVQLAVFKFCFIDFGASSSLTTLAQVTALEASYRTTMAQLQASAPTLRLVHVTPPLRSYWNSDANDLRVEFGRFLKAEYGATGFVFDLQDVESHDATGAACARAGVPVICEPYVGGTGHLTDLGAERGAKALLWTLLAASRAP